MMESRQRPLDSPSSRPLHVLLSLITSTVVSTLETGIHTRTLLLSLIPSSRSTMESLLTLSILLTWMLGRSIDGFGLSPGITKEQRLGVENLMKNATATFS